MRTQHVVPRNDLRAHDTSGRGTKAACWCEPTVAETRDERGYVIGLIHVHHAADGRDLVEKHGVN